MILAVVSLVLQVYVLAPDAVNVAVLPIQMVGLFAVITGKGLTSMVAMALFLQPLVSVPVTV